MSFWSNNFPYSRNTDSDLRQLIEMYQKAVSGLESLPQLIQEYVTESGLIANLQSNMLLDIINIRYPYGDLEACAGDSVSDDTTKLQAFINYAAANNKILYAPAGRYLINTAGQMAGGSVARDYCLKIPSNLKMFGEGSTSTFFVTNSIDSDLFTTIRTIPTRRLYLSGLSIIGSGSLAGSNEGFGLWLYHMTDIHLDDIIIQDCANWNLRMEWCSQFHVSNSRFIGGINTNSDSFHMVDCSYGYINNIECISQSDDGFVFEANQQPIHDIFTDGVNVRLVNAIGLKPRGIGFFSSTDMEKSHYNIVIDNAIVSSNGFDVQVSTCRMENCRISGAMYGSDIGLYLQASARSSRKEGLIKGCTFDLTKDGGGNPLVMAEVSGSIQDCNININAINYSGYVQLKGNGNVYNMHLSPKSDITTIGVSEGSCNEINLQWRLDTSDSSIKFTVSSGQRNIINVQQLSSGGGIHISSNDNQINGILRSAITTSGTGNQNNTFVPA